MMTSVPVKWLEVVLCYVVFLDLNNGSEEATCNMKEVGSGPGTYDIDIDIA